jgi:hypothetical protein
MVVEIKLLSFFSIFRYWIKARLCPAKQPLILYPKVGLYLVRKLKVPIPARNLTFTIQPVDE